MLERSDTTGVPPVVPEAVWVAAADPTTWSGWYCTDRPQAMARMLGGHPVNSADGTFPQATVRSAPLGVCAFPVALGLWAREPALVDVDDPRHSNDGDLLAGASLGGLRGGARHPYDRTVIDRIAGLIASQATLAHLGGVTVEVAMVADRHGHLPDWWRAVRRLLADGTVRWAHGRPLVKPVELCTTDPRVAPRVLQVLSLPVWDATDRHPSDGILALSAVASTGDRGAIRMLLERLADGTVSAAALPAVRLALRSVGVTGHDHTRVRFPWECRVSDAPVLWWRRLITMVMTHPDRPAAVRAVEDAWVRLVGARVGARC